MRKHHTLFETVDKKAPYFQKKENVGGQRNAPNSLNFALSADRQTLCLLFGLSRSQLRHRKQIKDKQ